MSLNWTSAGAIHTEGRHEEFEQAFRALEWREPKGTFGLAQAMAFEKMIEDLPGGDVLAVAESPVFAPFNLLAMKRGGFRGGPVIVYALDEGDRLTLLASEQIREEAIA